MSTCRHCQHALHWEDDACPGCGAEDGHIDAEGLEAEAKQTQWVILSRFYPVGLAALMVLVTSLIDVSAFWAAVIALAIIALVAFAVICWKSARRTKQWSEGRKKSSSHRELYAHFLEEHPTLRSSLPKERHEAFRKWLAARPDSSTEAQISP